MSTADKIDDSWPHTHGTVDGYDHGCRGGSCPAGDEYGLSCKLAKSLSRNDYRYGRLVKAGSTVAEIAAEFDLVGTSTPEPAKPKTAAKTKRTPKPAPPASAPDVVQPSPDPEPIDDVAEADSAAPVTPAAPSAQEIRKWARDRGYELPSFGRIPNHIRAHYDEAHAPKHRIEFTTAEEIRALVGPLRHENGQINASAIAQEATLRERAGLPSWIAALDAPMAEPDTEASDLDTEISEPATEAADLTSGDESPVAVERDLASGEMVAAPIGAGILTVPNVAVVQQAEPRPEWGHVALQEDLERANAAAAIALEERDRGRALAARLFDEMHRAETTASEHRERSAAALADYLRDLAEAEQARNTAVQALAAEAEGRRIAESALQLTLQKWGQLKAVEGEPFDAQSLIAEARDLAHTSRLMKHGASSHVDMIDDLADALEAALRAAGGAR